MAQPYEVQFEVEGPAAMFTRPDTGSTPISYPLPTFSAAKGMFDAVLRRPHVYVHPTRIQICRPVRYERYVTNYGGPLRKGKDIREKNSYQFMATILVEVCYRIHGEVRMKQMSTRGNGEVQLRRRRGQDWRPRFKELFDELRSALTEPHRTEGSVTRMTVRSHDHLTASRHHFPHILMHHGLMGRHVNAAIFPGGRKAEHVIVFVDCASDGAEAVMAIGEDERDGECF